MEGLEQELDKIEKGLNLFDTGIPTLLGEEINAVGIDDLNRLAIVVAVVQGPKQKIIKEVLRVFYLWNFTCDFSEDFFAEAKEQTGSEPAQVPPRIVVATDKQPTAAFWSYMKNIKDSYIDVDIYRKSEAPANGGNELFWLKVDWPEDIKPLSRAALHRFNKENSERAIENKYLWDQLAGGSPNMRGYDKKRTLKAALDAGLNAELDDEDKKKETNELA